MDHLTFIFSSGEAKQRKEFEAWVKEQGLELHANSNPHYRLLTVAIPSRSLSAHARTAWKKHLVPVHGSPVPPRSEKEASTIIFREILERKQGEKEERENAIRKQLRTIQDHQRKHGETRLWNGSQAQRQAEARQALEASAGAVIQLADEIAKRARKDDD